MKRIKLPDWMLMTLLMISAIGALPKVQAAEPLCVATSETQLLTPKDQ